MHKKAIINDIITSIRLIDDECNTYIMLNAQRVKRIVEKKTAFIMCCANDVLSKDKALLCGRTKKSPYKVPSDKPRMIENMMF